VSALRGGQSERSVSSQFEVSRSVVRRWFQRAGLERLDRVDRSDHRNTRGTTHNRTSRDVEECILKMRNYLKVTSVLGVYGAAAIHRIMNLQSCPSILSIRTINRTLHAELDSFDYIEDLRLSGKHGFVQLLNGISLHSHWGLFVSVSLYDYVKYSVCVVGTLAGIWNSFLRSV
jgi:hypothetical protein